MTTATHEDTMTDFSDRDTWDMRPRFKLRRLGMDGPLFVAVDPLSDPLPVLTEGFIGLELKEGVDRDAALALLDQLEDMVAFVTYTGGEPTWSPAPGRAELCRQIEDMEASADVLDDMPERQHLAAELRQQADALRRLG